MIITVCIIFGDITSRTRKTGRSVSVCWLKTMSSEKPASTAPLLTAARFAPRSPAGTSFTSRAVMPLALSAIRMTMLLTDPGAV